MSVNGKGWEHKKPGWVNKLLSFAKQLDAQVIAVGFPKGKCNPYPTGESVAGVAMKHVIGDGVMKRDFMTYAQPLIQRRTKPLMAKIATAKPEEVEALAKAAGMEGASCIKEAILEGDWAPNSDAPMSAMLREDLEKQWGKKIPAGESYKAAKLRIKHADKPLVLSSHMVNSVTFDVRDR